MSRPLPLGAKNGQQLCLTDGELHVWQARLDTTEDELSELARLLSPDERERAAQFSSSNATAAIS